MPQLNIEIVSFFVSFVFCLHSGNSFLFMVMLSG